MVVAGRTKQSLDEAAQAITKAGYQASALVMDIADIDGTKAALDETGPYDIIVNCAGLARHKPTLGAKKKWKWWLGSI